MKQPPHTATSCRSVFRGADSPLTTERYTQLWIRMINQIERTRANASGIQ